jgi:hypothetical protein
LCNEGLGPFPLILLQRFKRFRAEEQRHTEQERRRFSPNRKKITCGVLQRIELKTKSMRKIKEAYKTSGNVLAARTEFLILLLRAWLKRFK